MTKVDLFFKCDGVDQVRKFEVARYEDAIAKFHEEFPDVESRPPIHEIRVENLT